MEDLGIRNLLSKYFSEEVICKLEELGLKSLYPTQALAIRSGVLDGKNIVLSAPTASGKTLVAELTALKHLKEGGKVLYLVPLRALASEKYKEFKKFFGAFNYKTVLSTGDYDSADPSLGKYPVIVTTNEKADSLLRHNAPWFSSLTLVVADEIHLLGTEKRGATLEALLTRILISDPRPQILGLSATIGNLEDVARWLDAKPVKVDWRPVILREGVYYDENIFFSDGSSRRIENMGNSVVSLTYDTLKESGQVLIFSPTRRSASTDAKKLAGISRKFLSESSRKSLQSASKRLASLHADKLTHELAELLPKGVAFHHAGLSSDTREIVEELFREGHLKVVVATPTLAAGVNLPARRVIIADHRRYNVELGYQESIPVMEYKQMAGRAGRPKYDREGEAVLIARSFEEVEYLFKKYIYSEPESLQSQLGSEPALRSQILAVISTDDRMRSMNALEKFLERTFFSLRYGTLSIFPLARKNLQKLIAGGLIEERDGYFYPTFLGKRIAELYIDPETALEGIKAFKQSQSLEVLGYLFLVSKTPDMTIVSVKGGDYEYLEEVLESRSKEIPYQAPQDEVEYEFFLSYLKTALLLEDWVNEVPEDKIVEKYDVGPGDIYSLTQTAEWIAFSLSQIAEILGFHGHSLRLSILSKRIAHGVKEELLELVALKGIGRVRARKLYEQGYKSIYDLAVADEKELLRIPGFGQTLVKAIKSQLKASKEETEEEGSIEEAGQVNLEFYF
jgi:helicase